MYYYLHFTAKRKEFRDLARNLDGESVTAIMIDSILSMHEIPDRFSALVKLFEEEFGKYFFNKLFISLTEDLLLIVKSYLFVLLF